VLAAACLAGAILSKETGLVVPLLWFAADRLLPEASGPKRSLRARAALYIAAIACVVGGRLLLFGPALPKAGALENPLAQADHFARRRCGYLVPVSPGSSRSHAPALSLLGARLRADRLERPSVVAWLALVVGVILLAWLLRHRSPLSSFGLVWFLILFLPISNLLVAGPSVYGERLLYAPMIGVAAALSAGTAALAKRVDRPILAWIPVAALILGHGISAALRGRDWASSDRLFASGLEVEPNSALIQSNAAIAAFRDRHDVAAAFEHASIALRLWSEYPQALVVLGMCLEKTGQIAEADRVMRQACEQSEGADAASDYARFLIRHGRRSEAMEVLERGRRNRPNSQSIRTLLLRLAPTARP